jgi:hypothetical protein
VSDSKIKDKVRALLTKAERTEYSAEAEAFNAKAAELIAKHALDELELRSMKPNQFPDEIESRRYVVQAPYSIDRLRLIVNVALALGCIAYYIPQARDGSKTATKSKDHDTYAYIVGFKEDIDMVELMLESLNKQMEHEREREIRHQYFTSMGKKKVWNASFIRGYAARISSRLRTSYNETMSEATGSVAIVLQNKKERLQRKAESLGLVTKPSTRQTDRNAYSSGMSAADRATIHKSVKY